MYFIWDTTYQINCEQTLVTLFLDHSVIQHSKYAFLSLKTIKKLPLILISQLLLLYFVVLYLFFPIRTNFREKNKKQVALLATCNSHKIMNE